MNLTGQLGVPVTTDGQDVVVGFDQPKLKDMAARNKKRGLGLRITTSPEGGVSWRAFVTTHLPPEPEFRTATWWWSFPG